MTIKTDLPLPPAAPSGEDDATFWARAAAEHGFVRPDNIDPDQAWFWTREWIEGEIEADLDIAAGRTTFYASGEELLAALKAAAHDADLRDR